MPLPIIPLAIAGGAVLSAILGKGRPSNVVRVVEDGVAYLPKKAHKGAKALAAKTRVEYRARMLARLQQQVSKEAAAIGKLSAKERRALEKEQAAILARADELIESRGYYARREAATRRVTKRMDKRA